MTTWSVRVQDLKEDKRLVLYLDAAEDIPLAELLMIAVSHSAEFTDD